MKDVRDLEGKTILDQLLSQTLNQHHKNQNNSIVSNFSIFR